MCTVHATVHAPQQSLLSSLTAPSHNPTPKLHMYAPTTTHFVQPGAPGYGSVLLVTFTGFSLRLAGRQVALPLDWLSPEGAVDTLYLDEELRVSVGDKGSLFVVRRVP